jgi:transcriptional regulator with XRE-family HTH domain
VNRYELARAKAKLGLAEAAEKSGVGRTTISRIERGHIAKPQPAVIGKLADAYDVDVEYLIGLHDDEKAAA